MINRQGGAVPSTDSEMERAKKVDLITLPETVNGTNCFNCKFLDKQKKKMGFCNHPDIQQAVTARNCCAKWDSKGTVRPWEKK